MAFVPFTDEQARALINLEQRYQVWIEAERSLAGLPYDLRRKVIGSHAYLYEINDRGGNGHSLGPWSEAHQATFDAYRARKGALRDRREKSAAALAESGRLCRALRVPLLASAAGPILREADRRRLLDDALTVVGTNALVAYALESGGFIRDAPDETDDFDLAWSGSSDAGAEEVIWPMLKAVDPTFTVNTERSFQARNAAAYEIEILVVPSRLATLAPRDRPRPVPLPEQEWLLEGRRVDRIAACRDGSPTRIVAPDPRWFALQKLWMAEKPGRNPLKRPKDRKQGLALLDTIRVAMPHYPLDAGFASGLPGELRQHFDRWQDVIDPIPDQMNW